MGNRSQAQHSRRALLALQREICQTLKSELRAWLGPAPEQIQKYEREAESDFRGVTRLRACTRSDLVREIRRADVSFIGDFHTFAQAQRTALRLFRDSVHAGEHWIVGLEMLPSNAQAHLDAFQQGRIGEEEFHLRVSYEDEWGFAWRHYAPIFEWARAKGVRLLALNRPREFPPAGPDLMARDQWAAGLLTDALREADAVRGRRRKARAIVLYGDHHVATAHLPAQLEKVSAPHFPRPLRWLTIHQNKDTLYWRLARLGREHDTDGLRLRRGVYCVISGTPWAQAQSLLTWAEGGDPDDEETDPQPDYLSLVRTYGNTIARFLEIPEPACEALTLRTVDDADFLEELGRSGQLSSMEFKLIRFHVRNNLRILVPGAKTAYLATPSANGAAEIAALHLLRQRARTRVVFEPNPDDFFRQAIEAAFGFFGSLVINPRRKCDQPRDLRARADFLARNPTQAFHRHERCARLLALRVLETRPPAENTRRARQRHWLPELERAMRVPLRAPEAATAAAFAGQILGKRLHQSILSGAATTDDVRRLCLARSDGDHRPFEERYHELVALTSAAEPVPSKERVL